MNQQLEQQIRQIVQSELSQSKANSQFTVSKVPNHTHNGIDSPRVNEKSLSNGIKYVEFETFTTSGFVTIKGISNFKELRFLGGAALVASPITKKAIINGFALFGTCYTATSSGAPQKSNVIQTSNSLYIDTSSLTNSIVNIDTEVFAYVNDSTNDVAIMSVTSWDHQSITFQVTLATGWEIVGTLLIS